MTSSKTYLYIETDTPRDLKKCIKLSEDKFLVEFYPARKVCPVCGSEVIEQILQPNIAELKYCNNITCNYNRNRVIG
jgi:formate dehydrogenase maturation protein FdhE